jgi:polyhydroxyalkanoate synthase
MNPGEVNRQTFLQDLADELEKLQAKAQRARKVLFGSLNTDIAATPHEIVYQEDRVRLKYYRPPGTPNFKTPLLIVYALINRETMLDLQPDRSVIQAFLKAGLEVYMVDWGYPTRKDRYLTIEDHVCGYMNNAVDFIRKRHGIDKINLMGICMGGSFSVMYASIFPRKIKNLNTNVTPTHFDTEQGLLHVWMRRLDADRMVETYGNIPGDLMNFGFLLLNPARLVIDKYKGLLESINEKDFVENFVRMEKWIFDSPDFPGETFRQFIHDCYRNNLLIRNRMRLGSHRVNLRKITMPLLNIYARYDHLVPPDSSRFLTRAVGSTDTEDVCLDTGHIGIYVSSKSQKEFAPKVIQWLRQRDDR